MFCVIAAPAGVPQLPFASHQKQHSEPGKYISKFTSPMKEGKEQDQKLFQSHLNFLSIVVCKALLLGHEKWRIPLHISYFY